MNARILVIPLTAALVDGCAWLNEQPYYIPGGAYVQRVWVPRGGSVAVTRQYYYDGGRRYYYDGGRRYYEDGNRWYYEDRAAVVTSTSFAARSAGNVSSSGMSARRARGWRGTR